MGVTLNIAHSLPMTGKICSGSWSWTWSAINCSKARHSYSLWSIQFWPAASSLTGSHELMPKDHPMTPILTINPTIHQIVIWYICEDCGKGTICFECIPPYVTDEMSTQSVHKDIIHAYLTNPQFLIVSLLELSLGQFCTILQQNVTAWKGEQNHHWGPTGFTPTCKDQNSVDQFLIKGVMH